MASSGIAVDDSVIDAYQKIKTKKHAKYIIFKFSDDLTRIIVHRESDKDATYDDFRAEIDEVGHCYAIYDFAYTNKLNQNTNKLCFVSWVPEGKTTVKQKMLMSSSQEALKNKLIGLKVSIQAMDYDDIAEDEIVKQLRRSDQAGI